MAQRMKKKQFLLAGCVLLSGVGSAVSQQLPLPVGKPGDWKKAYHNIGIDTANTVPNSLSSKEAALGWELLFDGTLPDAQSKWKAFKANNFPAWVVNDNALARINGAGDIMTRKVYSNFVWALEWRISVGGNSGIFYRADESENNGYWTGPEVQVLHNQRHSDGLIQNGFTSAGGMYDMYKPINQGEDPRAPAVTNPNAQPFYDPTSTDASGNPSGYNKVLIIVIGTKHEYWVNGIRTVSLDTESAEFKAQRAARKFRSYPKWANLPEGHMFLQDHGNQVWFRNIKVRPLPANATFETIWPGLNPVSNIRLGKDESLLRRNFSVQRSHGGYLLDYLHQGPYQVRILSLQGNELVRLSGQGRTPLVLERSKLPAAGPYLLSIEGNKARETGKVFLP